MVQYILKHQALDLLVLYIILSNAVNALLPPTDKSSNFYKWFFTFSHGILLQAGRFLNKGANGNAIQNHVDVDVPSVGNK